MQHLQSAVSRLNKVLPEFAWMAEKTTALARASCSTKEHIRAIDGSVAVEEASNLHVGPYRAEMAELEVAQHALCFAAPPGLAKFRQRIDAHARLYKQISEEPQIRKRCCYVTANILTGILQQTVAHSCC